MDKKFIFKIGILCSVIFMNIYPSACLNLPSSVAPQRSYYEVDLNNYLNKLTCLENDKTAPESNKQKATKFKLESKNLEKGLKQGTVNIPIFLFTELEVMTTKECNFTLLIL
jgi:hypothetical protein